MALSDWYDKITYRLVKWWVGQGSPEAQFHLGYLYHTGRGVAQDHAEAAKWYRKAADQGLAGAQSNLGVMYGLGQGVPRDDVLSLMWWTLAASRFLLSETQKRDEAVKARDLVASRMTPEQVAQARKLALEWKPTGRAGGKAVRAAP